MFRPRSLVLTALCSLMLAGPVSAQSPADLARTSALLQAQIDQLRRSLVGRPDSGTRLWLDGAWPGGPGTALVVGWGFRCGDEWTQTWIYVDGLPYAVGQYPTIEIDPILGPVATNPGAMIALARLPREDVRTAFAGYCGAAGVPAEPGLAFLLDMTRWAPGRHQITIRMYDRAGREAVSNSVEVVR